MSIVVLDTDVASHLHKRKLTAEIVRALIGSTFVLTFVTIAELYKWMEIRSWGQRRRQDLEGWLDRVPVLPYDPEVAKIWGRLIAAAEKRGRPRPINDTWIAACCLAFELPLVTLNRAGSAGGSIFLEGFGE